MKKGILVILFITTIICSGGCGKQELTAEQIAWKEGYMAAIEDSDLLCASEGKLIIDAYRYGYLCGIEDAVQENYNLSGKEFRSEKVQELYTKGYNEGYNH